MSTDDFFSKNRESKESFPAYDFSDDPRTSKRGYEHLFELVRGNTIAGHICRPPKAVEVKSMNNPSVNETKLLLTLKTTAKTKGFYAEKGGLRKPYVHGDPACEILLLWVPETGNMTDAIDSATKGVLREGQYIEVSLDGLKDTQKPNLARQFSARSEPAPEPVASGVTADDLE